MNPGQNHPRRTVLRVMPEARSNRRQGFATVPVPPEKLRQGDKRQGTRVFTHAPPQLSDLRLGVRDYLPSVEAELTMSTV